MMNEPTIDLCDVEIEIPEAGQPQMRHATMAAGAALESLQTQLASAFAYCDALLATARQQAQQIAALREKASVQPQTGAPPAAVPPPHEPAYALQSAEDLVGARTRASGD